ncbi:MAG: DUF2165 family protein [Pseudomonadota bacterium]
MEQVVLLSQAGLMSVIAGWLILGVRDNILYPHQNQRLTDMVLCMEAMAEEYPQFYAELSHRRVTEPTTQKLMFRLIVGVELAVCGIMLVGILGLLGAVIGAVPAERTQALVLLGAFGFTMIWAAFLVAGNHFAYWLCHKEQQLTHYQMTLWGIGTMVFLVASQSALTG